MSTLPIVQLSCRQCQHRKIKCDKTVPCSACQRVGIVCEGVQRQRLPRGRSGKQRGGQALQDRIARLENIVLQARQKAPELGSLVTPLDTIGAEQYPDYSDQHHPRADSRQPVASEFWAELTDAVDGLRTVLEDEDGDAGDAGDAAGQLYSQQPKAILQESTNPDSHVLLFGGTFLSSSRAANIDLSASKKTYLLNVFRDRVDPIIKVLHWPTVYSSLHSDFHRPEGHMLSVETQALESAIHFAAVCSLQNHELDHRHALLVYLRREAERYLASANLLVSRAITVLQAFVIYLAALRACQANAQQWTLLATAIRIASAQGLSSAISTSHSLLDGELKRRLWFCIGLLDMQAAFDRGSRPILKSDAFSVLPLNVNDDELQLESARESSNKDISRFTEMSFSLVAIRAANCQRRLTETGASAIDVRATGDPLATWNTQLAILAEYKETVDKVSQACTVNSPPLQRFAVSVAQQSLLSMSLLLRRPLHKRLANSIPADDDFDVLGTATEVLEREKIKRSPNDYSQWSWHSWVKWYALAIVLAELCGNRAGPDIDRAWCAAQDAYEDYSQVVADTKSGLLWKPIAKLMRRAKAVQEASQYSASGERSNNDWNMDSARKDSISVMQTPYSAQDVEMASLGDLDTPVSLVDTSGNSKTLGSSQDNGAEAMSWFYWDSLVDDLSGQVNFEV